MTRPGVFLKLKATRKQIQAGDIFVCSIDEGKYIWGRVIRDKDVAAFSTAMTKGVYLVYLYNIVTENIDKVPELKKDNLLIPPVAVTKHEWTSGYFQLVGSKELHSEDILDQHCFHVFAKMGGKVIADYYKDEFGNKLNKRYEPCGRGGLINLNGLYEDVSVAFDNKERIEIDSYMNNSLLVFPKESKLNKTKEPVQIEVQIKIQDINNPDIDMLTFEELFEDVVGKTPFTNCYDELNQDPITIILETTDIKEAEKIIKHKMDSATFLNPSTNKEENLFKNYKILINGKELSETKKFQ